MVICCQSGGLLQYIFIAAHISCTLLFLNYSRLKYAVCFCFVVVVVVCVLGGIQTFLFLFFSSNFGHLYAFDKQLNKQEGMPIRSGLHVWQLVVILSKLFRDKYIFFLISTEVKNKGVFSASG